MRRPDVLALACEEHAHPEPRLTLLGRFDLTVSGIGVRLAPCSQQLLAYLAVTNRPVRRTQVAGVIWADVSDIRASGNLRSTLWRLRHLKVSLVAAESEHLRLSPEVSVDVQEADRLARVVFDAGSDIDGLEIETLPLSGELLPEWDFDWVILERERLRQIALHVLDALCERWTKGAHYAKAIKAGLAAIAIEPLRETSHRALIAAFLAEGNRSEAIRCFAQYRETLRRELNLAPSLRLQDLIAASMSS